MPRLEVLSLWHEPVGDDDMKHLEGLAELRVLKIVGNSRLTDAALVHLAGLKHLRKIYIQSSGITPQGEQKLRAALPELKFDGE